MSSATVINIYLTLSIACALINIAPTFSHLVQGHSGPGAFGLWVVILNILGFVNGVVWRFDAVDRSPIFCDISTRIVMVGPVGLLMANLCIIRYLSIVISPNKIIDGKRDKKRRMILDYTLCIGFPTFLAGVAVIYQAGRYQINRLAGCNSISALVWPAFILQIIWPSIICGVSCGYSVYVMYWLVRRHRDLKQLVRNSNTPLNMSRFVRMGAFSATYFCVSAPFTAYGTLETIAATGPYVPWKSWASVHNSWNKLSDVRQNPLYKFGVSDWLAITAGLVLFVFFAFAGESCSFYRKIGHSLRIHKFFRSEVHERACQSQKSTILPEKQFLETHTAQSSLSMPGWQDNANNPTPFTEYHSKHTNQPSRILQNTRPEFPAVLVSIVHDVDTA